mgnify:CR=1 FL=1
MAILYLIIIVAMIIFIISSFVALVRFWIDTRKYSTYYQELKDLKEKAEKQVIDIEEVKDNEDNN